MLKHILMAGGAIALTAAPAYAGGSPSSGNGGLLKCLVCSGQPGGGSGPISAGNLNAKVKVNVNAGTTNSGSSLLKISGKAGVHGNSGVSAAVKAKAHLPSLNLGGCGCE